MSARDEFNLNSGIYINRVFLFPYGRCAGIWPFENVESLSQQGESQRVE